MSRTNGNPVLWAIDASKKAGEAKAMTGEEANQKLAEAVQSLGWAVAIMAERSGMDHD